MDSNALLRAVFCEDTQEEVPPDVLEGVLATLKPREREVLELRFGGLTYEAVGHLLPNNLTGGQGVTKVRARMLTLRALRRLRHPSRSKFLKPYLVPECA